MVAPLWPEERTKQLCKLWAQGLSSTLIAIEFGMSRSAVLGKVNRLGLPQRRTVQDAHGVEVPEIEIDEPPLRKRAGRKPRRMEPRTAAQYREMLAQAVRNTKA